MRRTLALILLTSPGTATAWEFSPTPICTLTHSEAGIDITVTFDPAIAEYAIMLTRDAPWPSAQFFGMTFEGTSPIRISTDRHVIDAAGTTLSVKDRGFGNVLNGLALNRIGTAQTGDAVIAFSTADAAPAVAAFRDCPAPLSS